jgi:hypothetical protein
MNNTSKPLKKTAWFQLKGLFDDPAKKVMELNKTNVICQGEIYEGVFKCDCGAEHKLENIKICDERLQLCPTLMFCMVPPEAIGNAQGNQLQAMLQANLRAPVMVLTNNIQLVQLEEIDEETAKKLMIEESNSQPETKQEGAKNVDFTQKERESSQQR